MTRGATMTRSQERSVTAFEVEVEVLWVKLTQLRPGKSAEVWLTPNWCLALRYHPMSAEVGTYNREATLIDFREDCFWALNQARGRR